MITIPLRSVLLIILPAACGCTGSHRVEPRPAEGCVSNQVTAGSTPSFIFQSAEDRQSCVRLDFEGADTSGASAVPNVTVRGPFAFLTAWRVTGSCDDYESTEIDFHPVLSRPPSATPLETARGTLERRENALVRADLEVAFGEAPDGSLGPTSTTVVAEEVCVSSGCLELMLFPPEPCPAP
jgi:hypothetical protein